MFKECLQYYSFIFFTFTLLHVSHFQFNFHWIQSLFSHRELFTDYEKVFFGVAFQLRLCELIDSGSYSNLHKKS